MKQLFLHFIIIISIVLFRSENTVAQPANDLCANAILIPDNGTCQSGTTFLAIDNIIGLLGCQILGSGDVWYKFVATQPQFSATLTAGPLFGSIEFLLIDFGASPCVGTGTVLHSDCGSSPLNVTSPTLLVPGNTYYMVVSNGLGGLLGGFQICPLTTPIPANAIHVDGINDYIDCGNHPSLDLTEEVTVEAWVRATNTSLQGRLVYNGGGFSQFGYSLHFTNTNLLRAEIQGPGGNLAIDNAYPSPLIWHHVAFSYSNSKDSIWVYIDGVLVSQTFCNIGSMGLFPGNLTIGGIAAGGTTGCFEGAIDEVRIWNRAVCHSEIAARKNCQPTSTDPGLVAYYNFNQGIAAGSNPTVTVAVDGLNLSHGTLNNFALNGPTSNWINATNGVTGTCPAIALPEATVLGNALEIITGDIIPTTADNTRFPTMPIGSPFTHVFTINNPSGDILTISAINITGANASDFTLGGGTTFPLAISPGATSTFTITFNPSAVSVRLARIEIVNDDCNENPYLFNIQGIGAVPGTGLDFDGVNNHVNIGASITELQGAPKATMEAWVRSDFQGAFDKLVATVYGDLRLMVESGGRAKVTVKNGVNELVGTTGPGFISSGTNTWVHFAVVYDGTQIGNANMLKCYLNGLPVALTYTVTGIAPTTINPSPANFVMLGATANAACPQCFWDGAMDEVRIWCKARSQTEIQASMNCQLAGTEAGLVAYYNFNQGIADGNNTAIGTLTDSSPNNHFGTLNNFVKTGIGSNFTDVTINGVTGNCNLPSPAIVLQGNTVAIADGSNTPIAADNTEYGAVLVGSNVVHTFTISNTLGTANLTVSNITLSGLNPSEFSIAGISTPAIIPPGASTTFTVTFVPSIAGALSAIVNVVNNGICGDYDFVVQGFGASSCPYDNAFAIDMTPIIQGDTVSNNCLRPGEYVTVNVQAGEEYIFTTCSNTAGNDTELTLYDATGTTVLDYNDNACGSNSAINWTATLTGTVHVLLDQWTSGISCQHTATCTAVKTIWKPAAAANNCSGITPLCFDATPVVVASPITGLDALIAEPGNNYGCLLTALNPTWHYLEVNTSGNIDITASAPSNIDFIVWGPFSSAAAAQAACGSLGTGGPGGNLVDCSYSGATTETPSITGAIAGEVYVLMITNFFGLPQNVTISQTGGTGSVACTAIACNISSNSPVCAGDTLRLFDNRIDGVSWSWTGPNGFTSTAQYPIIPSVTTANAGIYTVTVVDTDANTIVCNLSVSVTNINLSTTVISNYNGAQISCNGAADGAATISIVGGTAPFTFNWSNGQTTSSATGLIAGMHQVTVSDGSGCMAVDSVILTEPAAMTTTMSQTDISCFGANDGTATVSVVGGTPPHTFVWSASASGQTTSTVTGLNSGGHSVVVVDANGCTSSAVVTIISAPPLAISPIVTNVQCFGDSTGVITVNGSGGLGNYSFLWSSGETTPTITGLLAGTYTVTLFDSIAFGAISNCPPPVTGTTFLPDGSGTSYTTSTTVNCFVAGQTITSGNQIQSICLDIEHSYLGDLEIVLYCPNGQSVVLNPYPNVTGPVYLGSPLDDPAIGPGTGATYCFTPVATTLLENGGTVLAGTPVAASILPGDYMPVNPFSNLIGCPVNGNWTIEVTDNLASDNGYIFNWELDFDNTLTPDSTAILTQFCSVVDTITVAQGLPLLTPDISAVDSIVCVGEDIQLLTTTIAAEYYWSGPNGFVSNQQNPVITTADLTNNGLYTLHVEDANGCFSPDTSIFISVNSEPYFPLTISGGPDVCIGDQIMIESVSHFCDSFLWIGPVQNQAGVAGTNFTVVNFGEPNYVTGIWTLQGMDTTTGCVSISNPIFINLVTPPPFPTPTGNSPICVGDAAVVSVPNVVGSTINWYLDSLKVSLIGSGANFILPGVTTDTTLYVEYVVANCFSGLASITISVAPSPTPNAPADFAVCEGAPIGLFTNTIASIYNWSGPNLFTSNAQNPIIPAATFADAGLYTLSVIDTNGCLSPDTTVFVTVNANPLPPAALSNSPVCFGQDLQIFHAGGCHQTRWLTPSSVVITTTTDTLTISSIQSEYQSGTWQVICEDTILGCISAPTAVNVIIHPPTPVVNAFNNGPVCVGGNALLSIPIIGGATYTWFADASMTVPIGVGPNLLVSNLTQDSTFYVEINVLGCLDTSFTTVFVNPTPPTPSVPADFAVCAGDILLLSTLTTAPGYQWTMPSGAIFNGANFTIFPATSANAGLYTLSIIDANGCPSTDTTVFVTVNALPPTPNITSLPVCMGSPLVLVASGNCDMVEWTGPVSAPFLDNDTLNVPSTAPNYVNGGAWTVRCIDTTTGCFSLASASHTVSINPMVFPPAVSNNSPVCIGGTVQLSSPAVAGTVYTWYAADSVTIVAAGSTVNIPNITANTSFVLEITRNGCSAMSATFVTVFPPSSAPLVSDTIKVCPSDTIFLGTPSSATAYNWSGPNGFASTLQNPRIYPASAVNAGTYTLSTLDINGCPAPDTTVEVVIHALPLPPVISSPSSTVCYNDTLFLNSSASCGQLWWEGPTGLPFLGTTNISIDNLDADFVTGNWTVTCIDTFTGCSAVSSPFAVVINSMPPTPILGSNSPVCVGEMVNLSMVLVAGATYQWSDAANNIVGATPNISVLATSTGYFYGEVTVNGCTAMDSILVIVNPIPPTPDAFTLTNPICEGDFLQCSTFTVAPVYNWSGPNGFTSNAQMPFIFPATIANAGTYFLNIIDFNGCQSLDTFVNIVVNPQPPQPVVTGATNLCFGDTIILQAQICQRLLWFSPFGPIITITGSDSLVIAPGTPDYGSGPWQVLCQDTITGCNSVISFSHVVTLNPLPAAPTAFNSGPVCVNESATLTVIPQPSSTYIWYADSLLTDTLGFGTSIIVDSLQADSTFYIQIINASGCDIVGTTTVAVDSPPAPPIAIILDSMVCVGEDVFLQELGGGIAYLWTGPNGYSSTAQLPVINSATLADAGTYTVFVTDFNGCLSQGASVNLYVNAPAVPPVISGGSNICFGDSIVLTTSFACDSMRWFGANGNIQGFGNQFIISPLAAHYGNADWTLMCFDTITGCNSISNTIFANVLPVPPTPTITHNGAACFGDSIVLSTPLVIGAVNNWYGDSLATIFLGTGNSIVVGSIVADSTYYLIQTVNGCSSPIASTTVLLIPTSPAPIVPADFAVCIGGSINLSTQTTASAYLWTHVNGFSSTAQNPTISPATFADGGTYTLSTIDLNGCPAPDTFINVIVNPLPPAPIIFANDPTCEGDTMSFGSNIPFNTLVQWVTPANDTIFGTFNMNIPSTDTKYLAGLWTVIFTDTITGCQITADTLLSIDIAPTGTASTSSPVCVGDNVVLTSPTIAGVSTYLWYKVDGTPIGSGQTITIPNIISDTVFGLVVVTTAGCDYLIDSVFVNVLPQTPAPPITVDTLVCVGEAIQFTTAPAIAYNWVGSNGFTSTAQNPLIPIASLADAASYTLNVTDINGCTSLDSTVNIVVNTPPIAPIASAPALICEGDTLFLNSNANTCDTAYWVGGNGTIIIGGANVVIPPSSTNYISGNWQVFCVDTLTGCETESNIINVIINPLPIAVAVNNGPVCINESVQLTANFVANATYTWYSDVSLTNIVGTNQVIIVDSISVDSTFYLVITDVNGCSSFVASTNVNVQVPAPAPIVGADIVVCEGEDFTLTTTTFSFGYNWTGPNGFVSNQINPVVQNATLADSGLYTLTVLGLNGCPSEDTTIHVTIDSLPNAPVINGFIYMCAGDTLFLNADSTSSHCDSVQWVGPNGQSLAIAGSNIAIAPGDTNYVGGFWQLQCIDTTTGCFASSNLSLVIIFPTPLDTQATYNSGPVCIGSSVALSTDSAGVLMNYTWYADSTLTNISGTGQYVTVNGITSDTTFYLVITNVGGCASNPIPTFVTVLAPANPPSIPADTQYCVGEPISLSTTTLAAIYVWESPNGFVSNQQNPIVTLSASVVDSGMYILYTIDTSGCRSADTSLHITVNPLPPIPSIAQNSPLCDGDTLILTSSTICDNAQWIGPYGTNPAVLGSPGSVLWTYGSAATIPPTDSNYQNSDWYMICIDTFTGCTSMSDTITVTIYPNPIVSSITTIGAVCAGDSVSLTTTVVASNSVFYVWYADAGLTTPIAIGGNPTIPNVAANTTFYVQVTDAITGCTTLDSIAIVLNPTPPAPILPLGQVLCEGDLITLTTSTTGLGYNWSGPNGFISNLQNPIPFIGTTLDSGLYTLSIIDANGCTSLMATTVVSVNEAPAIPAVTSNSPACTGDSVTLSASTIVGATYEWFRLPNNTSVGFGQNLTINNLILSDTGYYYVVATINSCSSASDSTLVTIYTNNSAPADAGLGITLCGVDTVTLNALSVIQPIIGTWTTNSGAIIINPNANNSFVANLAVGTNVFYWTLSTANCPAFSTDSVVVNVAPLSTDVANAGVNQNLCGNSTTTLTATSPNISTGQWTQSAAQTNAGVVIVNDVNPNSGITGMLPGNTYTFVWQLTNGVCGIHSTDTVVINVSAAPTATALAGTDIVTCSQATITLAATSPTVGTGLWTTNSAAIIINPNQNNTIVTNLPQGTTMFVWTLSNGTCVDYASDTMFVTLGGATPVANADNFTVTAGNTITTIDVLPNDNLTSNWTINLNVPINNGVMTNLNNGQFDLDLQGVTTNQSFIYELCNPACPTNCDTAIVTLIVQQTIPCVIPNIFTPNGDGVNDFFEIPCLDILQRTKLMVFNRWGDLVYDTDAYNNQWDGTHLGQPLPDGTYFYIMKIEDQDEIQNSIEIRR